MPQAVLVVSNAPRYPPFLLVSFPLRTTCKPAMPPTACRFHLFVSSPSSSFPMLAPHARCCCVVCAAAQAVKQKQPFQRLVMTKEDLLRMFEHNPFKQRIIQEKSVTRTEPRGVPGGMGEWRGEARERERGGGEVGEREK